jgi:excisionase family DNA binding protein
MTKLLSLDVVADCLGVSKHTVRAWVRKGRLRPVRLCRRVLFDPADVEQFIQASREANSAN